MFLSSRNCTVFTRHFSFAISLMILQYLWWRIQSRRSAKEGSCGGGLLGCAVKYGARPILPAGGTRVRCDGNFSFYFCNFQYMLKVILFEINTITIGLYKLRNNRFRGKKEQFQLLTLTLMTSQNGLVWVHRCMSYLFFCSLWYLSVSWWPLPKSVDVLTASRESLNNAVKNWIDQLHAVATRVSARCRSKQQESSQSKRSERAKFSESERDK